MNPEYLNNTAWFNQLMLSTQNQNPLLFNTKNNWMEKVAGIPGSQSLNLPKFSDGFQDTQTKRTTALWEGSKPLESNKGSVISNIFGSINDKTGSAASGIGSAFDLGKSMFKPLDNVSGASKVLDFGAELAKNFGPYGQIASAAMKGINLLDTALGKNAKSQITAGETAIGRDLDTSIKAGTRFGGLFGKKKRKQADVLTQKYDLSNMQKIGASNQFRQHSLAAQNSTQDIFAKNNQQLFGGVSYNMLAAKKGAKLNFKNIVTNVKRKLQKGGKLEVIEESKNVIPSGVTHGRKHNIELDEITKKGIPVITLEEGGEVVQHAEIEVNEIIFHKDLTKQIEELYAKHEAGDDQAAIEAGKLLVFEILENTDDKTGLIETV